MAIESAGIVLASDDPRAVVDVIRLSQASYRKMAQNLLWATGYNLFAIPVARRRVRVGRVDDVARGRRCPDERIDDRGRGEPRSCCVG